MSALLDTPTTSTPWRCADEIRTWASDTLQRGSAVILDTETTDLHGAILQVSVVDLAGRPLLDSLVHTTAPISPAAAAVHGITGSQLLGAPSIAQLAPALLALTAGREVLAYNADYDRGVLTRDFTAVGVDPVHLADPASWRCLMAARAITEGGRRRRLGGPHSAQGDCLAALGVLRSLAAATPR